MTIRQQNNELKVENWNLKHPVGSKVIVTKDGGEVVESTTTSPAEMLGGHTPVIWLEGFSGAYLLDRVAIAPNKAQFPANVTVHWPSGPVHACDEHARQLKSLGGFLGGHVACTVAPAGSECANCVNEAKSATSNQERKGHR